MSERPHIGTDYPEKPFYEHDCDSCKYLYSIHITKFGYHYEVLKELKVDVYEACDNSSWPYLIRYSNEPGDYATKDLKTLIANSCMWSTGMRLND